MGEGTVSWMRAAEMAFDLGRRLARELAELPGGRPDLVVGHCGLGPALFAPDVVDAPVVINAEYYHAPRFADLTYRVDLPAPEIAPFYPRAINAATLLGLQNCSASYAATDWQRRSFPARYRDRMEVHFDGTDTDLHRPRPRVPLSIGSFRIDTSTTVVTFVSRGLESLRGFDLFLKLAALLQRWRSELLFVVVGSEWSFYGWDRLATGAESFPRWAIARESGGLDLSRFLFLGQIAPASLAELLARSDLHLYLTVPFVPSWSLLDAIASGCPVVAGDVEPVRDLAREGLPIALAPLFDDEGLFEACRAVLARPENARRLTSEGRERVLARYSLDSCLPRFRDFLERAATGDRG
jgi:glycosyltransferase involved in cell wall biosynthesis